MANSDNGLKRGEARCSQPSYQEIIARDGDCPSPALLQQSYAFQGDADLPFERYTSSDFFESERQALWPHTWQWACREEHIPEAGDYYVYDVDVHSIIIIRADDGSINAFHNACTHRGTRLRPPESAGSATQLRCPFHGWTYDLQGKLIDLPCRWDFPHLSENNNLRPVQCDTWGGFVFVNLDSEAGSLAEYLAPLPDHLVDRLDLKNRVIAFHVQKELPTNWKAAAEAFMETYHISETHPQLIPAFSDTNAQYDVFSPHISRFLNARGLPSINYPVEQTQKQVLEATLGRLSLDAAVADVDDTAGVRRETAGKMREMFGAMRGIDYSDHSVGEMIDNIQYFIFPNSFFFPSAAVSQTYRFRPLNGNPGKTLFDILILRPLAEGEAVPEPPEPIRITEDESYTTIPGFDAFVAGVLDQDTGNIRAQWQGFHSTGKTAATLGNYQEILIRNFHNTIDRYLARKKPETGGE